MHIRHTPELAQLTTIRLGGSAVALVTPESRDDLARLPETAARLGGTPFILGRGSNLLAADGPLPLTLIRPLPWKKPVVTDEYGDTVWVRADASMPLPRLSAWAGAIGLSGLEPLTGIPGEVGGALRMNAGSYGSNFDELLTEAEVFSFDHGITAIPRDAIEAGYRRTRFQQDTSVCLILSAVIKLRRSDTSKIRSASRTVMAKKIAAQPVKAYSAGCVFANPEGASAGKLLDLLGFKGKKSGGMAFSAQHANFLINTGNGTSDQAFELIERAHDAVRDHFGIDLDLEVRILK